MRTVCLVLLVSLSAWAQSTGGTFGSGGLSGGGTSRTGSTRGGGSSSTGGSSLFEKSREPKREPSVKQEESPLEREQRELREKWAREEREQREAEFQRSHRVAGNPADLTSDPRVHGPAPTYLVGWRLPHLLIGLGAFALAVLVQLGLGRVQGRTRRSAPAPVVASVDTTAARGLVLSLGFDWSVRAAVQAELQRLSGEAMSDDLERAMMISRLVALAKANVKGIRYASVREVVGGATHVEGELLAAQAALRARYTHDTVGAARQRPEVQARPLEGPGLVVLSVLIGSTFADTSIGDWLPLEPLLDRVDKFTPLPQLLHVVWSPAVEGDRLSSAELEVLYPELQLVGAARLGRVACGRCNAVYALELERCPSCGAQEDRSAGKVPAPPCSWCGHATPAHETKCGHCGAFVEGAPLP